MVWIRQQPRCTKSLTLTPKQGENSASEEHKAAAVHVNSTNESRASTDESPTAQRRILVSAIEDRSDASDYNYNEPSSAYSRMLAGAREGSFSETAGSVSFPRDTLKSPIFSQGRMTREIWMPPASVE